MPDKDKPTRAVTVKNPAAAIALWDPKYLLGLGEAYVEANLLDAAEEVLARIFPEHSTYDAAAFQLLNVHERRHDASGILRLSDALEVRGGDLDWLWRLVGCAHYWLGETAAAKEYLWRFLKYLPENVEVQRMLEHRQTKARRPMVNPLIEEGLRVGMGPHVILDCIAPLLWDGRSMTCCFDDQFLFSGRCESWAELRQVFLALAAHLYEEFGIYTAFVRYIASSTVDRYCCKPMGKVFFSRRPTLFDEVAAIEQLFWKGFDENGSEKGVPHPFEEREGGLLGYPACCRRWATETKRAGKGFEAIALMSLIAEDYASMVVESGKIAPPEFAYFGFEFYPCTPRCAAAEEIGRDILARYAETDRTLADFYRHHVLPLNKAKMWYCLAPYQDFVGRFNARVHEASLTTWQRLRCRVRGLSGRASRTLE